MIRDWEEDEVGCRWERMEIISIYLTSCTELVLELCIFKVKAKRLRQNNLCKKEMNLNLWAVEKNYVCQTIWKRKIAGCPSFEKINQILNSLKKIFCSCFKNSLKEHYLSFSGKGIRARIISLCLDDFIYLPLSNNQLPSYCIIFFPFELCAWGWKYHSLRPLGGSLCRVSELWLNYKACGWRQEKILRCDAGALNEMKLC